MGTFLDALNAFFHIPVLHDYLVYSFWFVMMLLSPLVGMAVILYDLLSGHIWT